MRKFDLTKIYELTPSPLLLEVTVNEEPSEAQWKEEGDLARTKFYKYKEETYIDLQRLR